MRWSYDVVITITATATIRRFAWRVAFRRMAERVYGWLRDEGPPERGPPAVIGSEATVESVALRVGPRSRTLRRIVDRVAHLTWRDLVLGAPIIAYAAVTYSASAPEKITGLLVGLALIAVCVKRPGGALVALVG